MGQINFIQRTNTIRRKQGFPECHLNRFSWQKGRRKSQKTELQQKTAVYFSKDPKLDLSNDSRRINEYRMGPEHKSP